MLRILSGKFRGRRLKVPAGRKTRPTSARVREAVFDILEHSTDTAVNWSETEVLDLYAGSGANGLEAISRGAVHATLVDRHPQAVTALTDNVKQVGVQSLCTVIKAPVFAALERLEGEDKRFGLVFLDPPYDDREEAARTLDRLASGRLLSPGACVVAETSARRSRGREKHNDCTPLMRSTGSLNIVSRRRWGDTEVVFYRHA